MDPFFTTGLTTLGLISVQLLEWGHYILGFFGEEGKKLPAKCSCRDLGCQKSGLAEQSFQIPPLLLRVITQLKHSHAMRA